MIISRKIRIGLLALVGILLAYNLIIQIREAMKSGERLGREAENLYKLEVQNKQLQKQLSAVKSPEFIEAEARNKLGLAKPGEVVVVIPENRLKEVMGATGSAEAPRLPNWLGWWKLFFP